MSRRAGFAAGDRGVRNLWYPVHCHPPAKLVARLRWALSKCFRVIERSVSFGEGLRVKRGGLPPACVTELHGGGMRSVPQY